ncbi:sodium ion-translocating decarboxylase subunit beta [Lacrimispora aerotolerans]|nr:sodium ion-translocating decarboxylase subunit beta [Lacrimispora aerotolerans]
MYKNIDKMELKEDSTNHLLMHAIGANVSGQIGSVVAGGVILNLMAQYLS